MPDQPHYPGVYVTEVTANDPIIAARPTQTAGFVGYTTAGPLHDPVLITSFSAFVTTFGNATPLRFTLKQEEARLRVKAVPNSRFYLSQAVRLFFENGGRRCWIVAVGHAGTADAPTTKRRAALANGLARLDAVEDVALVAVPDAVLLRRTGFGRLAQAMLDVCAKTPGRFAIIDVRKGHRARNELPKWDVIDGSRTGFRGLFGDTNTGYGAAYYPFLNLAHDAIHDLPPSFTDADHVRMLQRAMIAENGGTALPAPQLQALQQLKSGDAAQAQTGHRALLSMSPAYAAAMVRCVVLMRRVPPSGAIAGVMAQTDARRGVWKAPAGVAISGIRGPSVILDDTDQKDLNPATEPLQVNPIRQIAGRGSVVWGARTMAGTDNDYRYVNVRRFLGMLDASLHQGLAPFVFKPNTAETWARVRATTEVFLAQFFRDGAFQGTREEQAFYVRVGLHDTMTQADLDNGRIVCEVGVAPLRPAEFIVLRVVIGPVPER